MKSFNCERIIDRSCSIWHDVSSLDCQQLCLNNSIPDDCTFFNHRQCHSATYDEKDRECVFQTSCKLDEVLFEKVTDNEKDESIQKTLDIFSKINAICIAVFTIEILLRLFATPKVRQNLDQKILLLDFICLFLISWIFILKNIKSWTRLKGLAADMEALE